MSGLPGKYKVWGYHPEVLSMGPLMICKVLLKALEGKNHQLLEKMDLFPQKFLLSCLVQLREESPLTRRTRRWQKYRETVRTKWSFSSTWTARRAREEEKQHTDMRTVN